MPLSYLKYKLVDGFIQHWLTAGPEIKPLHKHEATGNVPGQKIDLLKKFYTEESEIDQQPVEPGPVGDGILHTETYQGKWSFLRCAEDHLVVVPTETTEVSHVKAWAYVELQSKSSRKVILEIFTSGTFDLWIRDEHAVRKEASRKPGLAGYSIPADLEHGRNGVLLRCEDIVIGKEALALAVRIANEEAIPATDIKVVIPSSIPHPIRRNELEKAYEEAYIDRDVFSSQTLVEVKWPKRIHNPATYMIRLQTLDSKIYAQAEDKGRTSENAFLGHSASLKEGPYEILFMPVGREYYEEDIRITRRLPIWITGNHPYSAIHYGSFEKRKNEALSDATRRQDALFGEIANMALGKWSLVELSSIQKAIEEVKSKPQNHLKALLGLLGTLLRYSKVENEVTRYLQESLSESLLKKDLFSHSNETIPGEVDDGQKIIRLTIQLLSSQNESDQHRQRVIEQQVEDWLIRHGQEGFENGDSPQTTADVMFALSYLVDLAVSDRIFDMAGALMDKLLLNLAINSYKGVYGGGYGDGITLNVINGCTQPTSGICRLFWGMGVFNHHLEDYVSLSSMENYQMPSILADIATAQEDVWGTEKFSSFIKTSYRTTDFMLNAAQEVQAVEGGKQEHLWQATLGSEAIVFCNHPGANSFISPNSPGFWCGNSQIPKIAHWKDVLIAIYNAPEDDWMGFTHAYFPTYAFDEYKKRENWFFARKGEGYLAITASNQVRLIKTGESAYRELRCQGRQAVWICQMGRAQWDGKFSEFIRKVQESTVRFNGLKVAFHSLRGERFTAGWDTPFQLNDLNVEYSKAHHIQYPFATGAYPMKSLEVLYNEYLLKLNFDQET